MDKEMKTQMQMPKFDISWVDTEIPKHVEKIFPYMDETINWIEKYQRQLVKGMEKSKQKNGKYGKKALITQKHMNQVLGSLRKIEEIYLVL